jgi:signal transduction histidine kinase/CheY-like chemotaxis protein
MSSTTFPHFIFLIGLNFINVLCQGAETGPSFRFAEKIEQVPSQEFFDILHLEGVTYLSGDGVYAVDEVSKHQVLDAERITAICGNPSGEVLAFAGVNELGMLPVNGGGARTVPIDAGFIWSLAWVDQHVWFFGSEKFGYMDPATLGIINQWDESFSPRPLVSILSGPDSRLFVGCDEGVYEISPSGRKLVIPLSRTGENLVTWVDRDGDQFLLGTNHDIYEWDGRGSSSPVSIESNYGGYFQSGINNSVGVEDYVAITEYPHGVALWNKKERLIDGYISRSIPGGVGDVYKVALGERNKVLLLGDEGVAVSDPGVKSRFFPVAELPALGEVAVSRAGADAAYLFSSKKWVRLDDRGYTQGELSRTPVWVDFNDKGNLIIGANTAFEELNEGVWEAMRNMPFSIIDLKQEASATFALGVEGVYTVSDTLDLELIFPTQRAIQLLGEYDEILYFLDSDGRLNSLVKGEAGWQHEPLSEKIQGEFLGGGTNTDGVWMATASRLYEYTKKGLAEHPFAAGWRFIELSVWEDRIAVLLGNDQDREWATGLYSKNGKVMLSIPHKEYMGDPVDVMLNGTHLGVVGSNGVGWFPFDELSRLAAPRVDFALLFEDKRVEDRTIPPGMHFIDLQVSFSGPDVPALVQYRINEDRWRTVNLSDPSLQFAGHGSFNVELRAIHPNGNVSRSKLVQFGIAPPWYLNPVYQGLMLFLAVAAVWFLYYLRSAQLKRTNAWLQREVKKQTRELESATAARTNFLAGLSHDIRNPLNGVLMIAETLGRNPPKSGEDPRLKDLTEFGIIVDRMLGEILDFSAIDQDRIPTSLIPVSVMDIIDSSVKQNQFSIQHEIVTLETAVAEELKGVVIRTDRNWMIKVLSNLIVNALEYSESNRVEVGARCLRLTETEVDMELHVADWGIGIDESEKPFVFERFYRGESGIESGKHGTGLGLSICQEIAHAIGGHIRIEDNEPSGCRFVLTGRFDRMEETSELDKEAVLEKLRGQRILIVDDLVYNRKSIVEFFETIGCLCDQAENGRDALRLLDENSYYLALLDWDLPGLTGPEIARRHRKSNSSDPVILIAVTAYTDGEKKRESEEAGMNGYISKPLTATRLAYCLANIENWKPEASDSIDKVDTDEVLEEIYKHIEDCLHHGEHYEWEELRRCAHRLTTLALIKNNRAMQQVCRDLQISASEGNIKEAQVGLLELHKWRKP